MSYAIVNVGTGQLYRNPGQVRNGTQLDLGEMVKQAVGTPLCCDVSSEGGTYPQTVTLYRN